MVLQIHEGPVNVPKPWSWNAVESAKWMVCVHPEHPPFIRRFISIILLPGHPLSLGALEATAASLPEVLVLISWLSLKSGQQAVL